MSETVRHGLALLSAGQAQKEITHNEALLVVDRLLHLAVVSRQVTAPPPAPEPGDTYIVAPAPSGSWTGFSDQLATFDGFGWVFTAPIEGCLAWIADEASFAVFFDAAWSSGGWPASGLQISGRQVLGAVPAMITVPAGGALIDTQARSAIVSVLDALRAQGIIV
jgi:hypothetical protein